MGTKVVILYLTKNETKYLSEKPSHAKVKTPMGKILPEKPISQSREQKGKR